MSPCDSGVRNFVLIAANPRAGAQSRDRHLRELAKWLREHGQVVEVVTDLAIVEQLARDLYERGQLRALVGAGGDGTLAELVNRTSAGTPLAIYPTGTANLVARYIGVSGRPEVFGQMVLDGATAQFDAGRANGRLFTAVCSCGFDAEVVRRLHTARTGNITTLAYLSPIVTSIANYQFPELKISWTQSGRSMSTEPTTACWAFVSNLPCYAGGLKPGAGADGQDGLLDLCTLKHGGFWQALRYIPYIFAGSHRKLPDCTTARATRIRIESDVPDVPYEVDGDAGGVLPVEIDILPKRLTLVVPSDSAVRQEKAS